MHTFHGQCSRRGALGGAAMMLGWMAMGLSPSVQGQEPGGGLASCRIFNHMSNSAANVGSGTLIDVAADRQRGLVLTCAHLFTEGTGRVIVQFADGRTHGAHLLAIDGAADLAALEIAQPGGAPATVHLAWEGAPMLTACGFGPTGEYRVVRGALIGAACSPGRESLRIGAAVRSGDSGGGVFDPQGRLVAVVWGESAGVTYATSGAPLRAFLQRLTSAPGQAPAQAVAMPLASTCPGGLCPRTAPRAPAGVAAGGRWVTTPGGSFGGGAPAAGAPAGGAVQAPAGEGGLRACACGCDRRLADLATRLESLAQQKQDRGDYVLEDALGAYARTDEVARLDAEHHQRHRTVIGRLEALAPLAAAASRAAAPAAAAALGISGPAGWGLLAAASLGAWALARRRNRRGAAGGESLPARVAPAASDRAHAASQEATAAAEGPFPRGALHVETHAPIERDDREARELLRLSQLEGRDPLQDALAGRLALDRLDALAEGDADPQRARLADDLRRELRDRFNEIAPTKFRVRAES
ncbi:MAG TPA: serine protease [Lacipirellulaceae bacterium]|nr:serine protease [Lacipirellulaceae bacterium]